MKFRPLKAGLLVEGNSDEAYLSYLIDKQLDELTRTKGVQDVQVYACEVSPVRMTGSGGRERVCDAAWELAEDCNILFLHADSDAEAQVRGLVAELEGRRTGARHAALPVPILTVLMTESWMLADRAALESVVPGGKLPDYPYCEPSAVEGRVELPGRSGKHGPKDVWRALLGSAAHEVLLSRADALVERTDLGELAKVPSYRLWRDETEAALAGLRYL